MIVPLLRDELHQIETKIKTLLPEIDSAAEDYVNLVANPVIPHHHRVSQKLTPAGWIDFVTEFSFDARRTGLRGRDSIWATDKVTENIVALLVPMTSPYGPSGRSLVTA